jgi:hypothetical protein
MSGTSNLVNLFGDTLNNNGTGGNGDGATIKAFGQSSIVMNAYVYNPTPTTIQRTTFDNNVGNGVSVDETPGAQFGDPSTNTRSKFDGVDLSGNGLNGIVFASEISGNPIGDVASRTYFQLTSVGAVTTVQNNGSNGIATEYQGGHLTDANGNYLAAHDILIQGNTTNGLYIQNNGGDGIHADIGNFADLNMTVDTVTIGGTALTAGGLPGDSEPAGNQGNGIWFSVQMSTALSQSIQSIDEHAGLYNYVQAYERAGAGTLNVNNSIITNNTLNGIELYGNGLVNNNAANGLSPFADPAARTYNTFTDGYGNINANVTNNTIANNGQDGVDIQILGKMGSDRYPFSNTGFYAIQQENASGPTGIYNDFNFTNNNIVNNGNYGMFIEQNAAKQYFNTYVIFLYENFDGTPVPANYPIQPYDPEHTFGATYAYNNATNIGTGTNQIGGILDAFNLSNWMSLETAQSSILNVTNNTIQGNGQNHDLSHSDGIKIREGTDSYLAANLQGNNLTGNVGSSLYVESFTQYNPVTNVSVPIPFAAVHGSATAPDEVVLDYTAQLYMNLANNTGTSVNIVNPSVNFSATLPGNISGNGAYYVEDPQKNYPSPTNVGGVNRLVQLFEINNGANLNTTNSFVSNGIAQNLQNAFYQGDFYLEPSNNTSFPGLAFPQDYAANPGNPFVP